MFKVGQGVHAGDIDHARFIEAYLNGTFAVDAMVTGESPARIDVLDTALPRLLLPLFGMPTWARCDA